MDATVFSDLLTSKGANMRAVNKAGLSPSHIMSLTSKKEEGFVKVHLLGNYVWEQTAMIRFL